MEHLFNQSAERLADLSRLGRPAKIPGTRELILHASYGLVYEIYADTVWV
jgi:toxin ParE1/3/4